MKKFLVTILIAGFIMMMSGMAMAGETATQAVGYEVTAINELAITGEPTLTVNAAVAGQAPTLVSDALTSYAITTNQNRKITGAIDTAMPSGVTLSVALAAPGVGTSSGDVSLTAVAQDLVTGITPIAAPTNVITYKLSATPLAGVVSSASKTVTFTIAATL